MRKGRIISILQAAQRLPPQHLGHFAGAVPEVDFIPAVCKGTALFLPLTYTVTLQSSLSLFKYY